MIGALKKGESKFLPTYNVDWAIETKRGDGGELTFTDAGGDSVTINDGDAKAREAGRVFVVDELLLPGARARARAGGLGVLCAPRRHGGALGGQRPPVSPLSRALGASWRLVAASHLRRQSTAAATTAQSQTKSATPPRRPTRRPATRHASPPPRQHL